MATSRSGQHEILSHEAIVTSRYLCPAGVWTIGAGITRAAGASINPETFHGVLTLEECMDLFREVLPKYEAIVDALIGDTDVKQHEYDALVSLAWNVGNINQPKTRRLARSGLVSEGIDLWRANETPGLRRRRNAEIQLAETGQYKAETVGVYPARDGRVLWDDGRQVPVGELP